MKKGEKNKFRQKMLLPSSAYFFGLQVNKFFFKIYIFILNGEARAVGRESRCFPCVYTPGSLPVNLYRHTHVP